ncbi:phosphoglycolate phosphatase [Methanobrevibacter sp. AbM4]|uniref:phosphoglycolate phosphatase n=1 Tax=Methanobrevibacter sp. AbM4 TaxID=224719 RepID=UPI0003348344|nr:phosphoglycolate phosphatase [Methanobrevibacter sp. AbM4]AGN16200.1 phosphoglycolate phosphatase Gph [Methanobrevibacter sp. AbM4]
MVNIEAIAVDIDGTITDGHRRLCISAMKAIREAENCGIPTAIVTGNVANFAYAAEVFIGSSAGIVFENGGGIFKEGENNNEILVLGDKTEVDKAHNHLLEEIPHIMVSSDNQFRVSEKCYYKDNVKRDEVAKAVEDYNVKVYDSGFALHITDPNVNKGTSLEKLLEWSNIPIDNVMAIGDSENDIEFLKHSGFKVAVANSDLRLKNIADYNCSKKYGDGVSEAIHKFVLND